MTHDLGCAISIFNICLNSFEKYLSFQEVDVQFSTLKDLKIKIFFRKFHEIAALRLYLFWEHLILIRKEISKESGYFLSKNSS